MGADVREMNEGHRGGMSSEEWIGSPRGHKVLISTKDGLLYGWNLLIRWCQWSSRTRYWLLWCHKLEARRSAHLSEMPSQLDDVNALLSRHLESFEAHREILSCTGLANVALLTRLELFLAPIGLS